MSNTRTRHSGLGGARQRRDGGTIRDIGTGHVIGQTDSLSRAFLYQVLTVQRRRGSVSVVSGRITKTEVRALADDIRAMGVPIVRWPEVGPDSMLIVDAIGGELEQLRSEGLVLAARLLTSV